MGLAAQIEQTDKISIVNPIPGNTQVINFHYNHQLYACPGMVMIV
jgi:hypothetical protein